MNLHMVPRFAEPASPVPTGEQVSTWVSVPVFITMDRAPHQVAEYEARVVLDIDVIGNPEIVEIWVPNFAATGNAPEHVYLSGADHTRMALFLWKHCRDDLDEASRELWT